MVQKDVEYRSVHAVVPQLDYMNGGLENIVVPPIQYSPYIHMGKLTRIQGGKIASGAIGTAEGLIHLGTGNVLGGLVKMGLSLAKTTTGVFDPGIAVHKTICNTIRDWENNSWKEYYFLKNFIPASKTSTDVIVANGVFDEHYCGGGHRYFENGDYFEGLFTNGKIAEGAYIFANGVRYLGKFDESMNFTGLGTLIYTDGTRYYGGFEQSKRHHVGAMWYTNGVYVGDWVNDMRHGTGFLRFDKKYYEGNWCNDQPAGGNG